MAEQYDLEVTRHQIYFSVVKPDPMNLHELYVMADLEKIERVFSNLIMNALRHTQANGEIRIRFELQEKEVIVHVEDTGTGIAKEDLPRVFHRFFKGAKSRNTTSGSSGLGLSICKEIIEQHKGRIWVSSELEQGSIFSFTLPRIPAQRIGVDSDWTHVVQ
jgi:two-component system phosphate regulon sensor histidine kinase PhoR